MLISIVSTIIRENALIAGSLLIVPILYRS